MLPQIILRRKNFQTRATTEPKFSFKLLQNYSSKVPKFQSSKTKVRKQNIMFLERILHYILFSYLIFVDQCLKLNNLKLTFGVNM